MRPGPWPRWRRCAGDAFPPAWPRSTGRRSRWSGLLPAESLFPPMPDASPHPSAGPPQPPRPAAPSPSAPAGAAGTAADTPGPSVRCTAPPPHAPTSRGRAQSASGLPPTCRRGQQYHRHTAPPCPPVHGLRPFGIGEVAAVAVEGAVRIMLFGKVQVLANQRLAHGPRGVHHRLGHHTHQVGPPRRVRLPHPWRVQPYPARRRPHLYFSRILVQARLGRAPLDPAWHGALHRGALPPLGARRRRRGGGAGPPAAARRCCLIRADNA
jgi:hypothetical protein